MVGHYKMFEFKPEIIKFQIDEYLRMSIDIAIPILEGAVILNFKV